PLAEVFYFSREDRTPKPRKNPDKTRETLRALESEVAGVLRETREKVAQLEILTEFSALLNSSLDTETIRRQPLEAVCKLVRCATASLFLVDEEKGDLIWETALGETGKKLAKTVRLPIDERSIVGVTAKTGVSRIINDLESEPSHSKKTTEGTSFKPRSMMS